MNDPKGRRATPPTSQTDKAWEEARFYIPRLSVISGSDRAISQAEHLNGGCPFIRRMLPPILLSIHGMGGLAKWRRETWLGQVDNQAACFGQHGEIESEFYPAVSAPPFPPRQRKFFIYQTEVANE